MLFPRRTFNAVCSELIHGLEDGSIVLNDCELPEPAASIQFLLRTYADIERRYRRTESLIGIAAVVLGCVALIATQLTMGEPAASRFIWLGSIGIMLAMWVGLVWLQSRERKEREAKLQELASKPVTRPESRFRVVSHPQS